MSLSSALSECGLNSGQTLVLSYLLQRGSRSASVIAKGTQIKRPTVYSILESLIDFGLVTKNSGDGTTNFASVSIDMIPKILERRAKSDFEKTLGATKVIREELAELKAQTDRDFVEYSVETLGATDAAYAQLFDACLGGDFCAIFNPQQAINPDSRKSVKRYLELSGKQRFKIREIAVDGPETQWYLKNIDNPFHELKLLPKEAEIRTNMIFRDNIVWLAHYSPKGVMMIKVSHADYFKSMSTVFSHMWHSLSSCGN